MASADAAPVAIHRALLSVSNDGGLVDLAKELGRHSVELIATSGTRTKLAAGGISARAAEELTGIGSWFDGRIKTLHPGLLGGILAPRTDAGRKELAERNLLPIDLVVVNFYEFGRPSPPGGALDPVEQIDVGGVTLARAAAKNFAHVVVASDPEDYPELIAALDDGKGSVDAATRRRLASRAFARVSAYDRIIGRTLAGTDPGRVPFPDELLFVRSQVTLRYGENPHQAGAVYVPADPTHVPTAAGPIDLLKGEKLSYTNLLDLDTALRVVGEFPTPTAAVVKHATVTGAASAATIAEAVQLAVETDVVARYGCVIAVNRPFHEDAPAALKGVFVDVLAAPQYDKESLAALGRRTKVKVVRAIAPTPDEPRWEAHTAVGRLLVQEADRRELVPNDFRPVTSRTATPPEASALDFAWRVVRHAKSNAVVIAQGAKTVGIGSGQPTRVKAVELALEVAGERAKGSVLASDAFFPFADGVEAAGRAGVAAILQPGGSVRDSEVIAAAEKFGIAMYFSGWRVFRH